MWLDTFNEMRKRSGYSLDELSEKSGVPKGTLSKISSGITKTPTLETMRALVYAMGFTLNDLDVGFCDSAARDITAEDQALLSSFHCLNENGKSKLLDYADDLVQSGKYTKSDQSPGAAS